MPPFAYLPARPGRLPLLLVALALAVLSGRTSAQETKLIGSATEDNDQFGAAVALSAAGNVLVVGSPRDEPRGSDSGSAYVFEREGDTWVERARLSASDGAPGYRLGNAVAVSGDGRYVVAGSGGAGGIGAAYVFVRSGDTWVEQAKLRGADTGSLDGFGSAVVVSGPGDTVAAGAPGDNGEVGSAYVFVRSGTTWTQQVRLTASDGATGDAFGYAVALDATGSLTLVGARADNTTQGSDSGSAYVFRRAGTAWSQEAKLTAADGNIGDLAGTSVALSDDGLVALVGAPNHYHEEEIVGGAFVFVRAGTAWSQADELLSPDEPGDFFGDLFGGDVALDGDGGTALVGAAYDDTEATNAGAAYRFRRSGAAWGYDRTLTASDGGVAEHFGTAIALDDAGARAASGAYYDEEAGSQAGAAYAFDAGAVVALDAVVLTPTVAAGGTLQVALAATNSGGAPVTLTAALEAFRAGDAVLTRALGAATLPAGQTASRTFTLSVPGATPPGPYTLHFTLHNGGALLDADLEAVAVTAAPGAAAVALAASTITASPNPSGGVAQLTFTLDEAAEVALAVYDVRGREVARLWEGRLEAGVHRMPFDPVGSGLPGGVYVYRLRVGEGGATGRLTVLR